MKTKQLSTVARLLYCMVLVMIMCVSTRLSRSISPAVYRLSLHIFWLSRYLVDPDPTVRQLAACIVCGPLQFWVSQKHRHGQNDNLNQLQNTTRIPKERNQLN